MRGPEAADGERGLHGADGMSSVRAGNDGHGAAGERTVWQTCSVNCGSHCALRFHVKDGRVRWVETDDLPEEDAGAIDSASATAAGTPQMRACLRGRAMRYWLDSPDRLNYPLRRVGPRGSGRFERITWDEALDEVAAQIERVVREHGNEAVLLPYATGLYPVPGSPFERLMNCYGGFLGIYGDYSCAQLQAGMKATYGDDGYFSASTLGEAARADVVVMFGSNPGDTRMGGAGSSFEFLQARERGNFRVYSIDPRHTDVVSGADDVWIPIRPGTDAAFVAGVAHVLIEEGLVDQAFLDEYCVGFDEGTMPEGAPRNASYKDYVLGTGPDGVAKTPRWAAAITQVPARTIEDFARDIGSAERVFVTQGWGPQRSEWGEVTARAIAMLAILTGNVGLPGTNGGQRERFLPFVVPEAPMGNNPVQAKTPAFMWLDAVKHGESLTRVGGGVRGAERLNTSVKLIMNHAGNCLTNQHADINHAHDVLCDEDACEFIVVVDVMMTDSARYADIVLPDLARAEGGNVVSSGSADIVRGLVHGQAWPHETFERRSAWEMALGLAERLGVREQFLDGLDAGGGADDVDRLRLELARKAFDRAQASPSGDFGQLGGGGVGGEADGAGAAADATAADAADATAAAAAADATTSDLSAIAAAAAAALSPAKPPALDELDAQGVWHAPYIGPTIAYEDFRRDPHGCPLPTPSGKIEIYSQKAQRFSDALFKETGERIPALPIYVPATGDAEAPTDDSAAAFPYHLIGYHGRQSTHSSFANVDELQALSPRELSMNPLDAARDGLAQGDTVVVESPRGALVTRLRVTPRIMPGVVALPQGAWHDADMEGSRLDWGGCINTLTTATPTRWAHANAHNTCRVGVRHLSAPELEELRRRG